MRCVLFAEYASLYVSQKEHGINNTMNQRPYIYQTRHCIGIKGPREKSSLTKHQSLVVLSQ